MSKYDKRLADITTQDVRSYIWRKIMYFLLGCGIGVVLLVVFALSVSK